MILCSTLEASSLNRKPACVRKPLRSPVGSVEAPVPFGVSVP